MKIPDDRCRQIAWRDDTIGLSIDQTRNRNADRSHFDVLLSQVRDHRRQLVDQLFRGHFADPALDHGSFRIDQSGARLSSGDVDADEMHLCGRRIVEGFLAVKQEVHGVESLR